MQEAYFAAAKERICKEEFEKGLLLSVYFAMLSSAHLCQIDVGWR